MQLFALIHDLFTSFFLGGAVSSLWLYLCLDDDVGTVVEYQLHVAEVDCGGGIC